MLLHQSYRSCMTRGALQRLPLQPHVTCGMSVYVRLEREDTAKPSYCSINQVLRHCLTLSLFGLKAPFSSSFFDSEVSDIFSAINVTIVPRGNQLAYVSPRIPQTSWKRFATTCLHFTFANKPTPKCEFGRLLAATAVPRAL